MKIDKQKYSNLNNQHSEENWDSFNLKLLKKIKEVRKVKPSAEDLISGILNRNRNLLSQAITLIESSNPDHFIKAHQVISGCLPHANQSLRIGITGIPGVGKSTFIENFGKYLTSLGRKVAVLAVDPSSSFSQGSILGDKTRMETLIKDENAYIRPSAAGETLGGVARKTRETITLCEAAGYDTILIETVGVGQSESTVYGMVDFFILLKITGAGDELQGIKRGIMEMADTIVINKADGDNISKAKLAKSEYNRTLHLFPPKESGWNPEAVTCSSLTNEGIPEIWTLALKYFKLTKENHFFEKKRLEQNQYWLTEAIKEQLQAHFYKNPDIQKNLKTIKKAVQNNEILPFAAAQILLEKYFKK